MGGSELKHNTDTLLHGLSGKRIVVTGAGGFIGSTLLRFVARYAADVRALLGAPGDAVWESPPQSQTKTLFADIRDAAKLRELMQGADVVVHAAGSPSVRASFEDPSQCASVHVMGTVAVMDACRAAHVSRVVYISSAEVYGRPPANPVCEDSPLRPLSPYGAAKAAAEVFVRTFARDAQIECCILRPFSVFGPRQSPGSLIATILSQCMHRDGLLLNDLKPVRDYCYVEDLAEAIALACVVDLKDETCNIGSGQGTSVRELAELILALREMSVPIQQRDHSDRPRDAEIYELLADIGRAATVLNWRPRTPLADGLRETIAWTRQHVS